MRIKEFEFENFMSHRLTKIDCTEFQSVLILGQEKNNLRKSMGVGKTTIFKGFEYVFFNYVPFNMDKVVRHGADKCSAKIVFEKTSGTYKVVRSRTKKGKADLRLYIQENDDWTDLSQKTVKETEVELAKILGISHGAWRAAILFAQADLHGLASVSPKERKAMLKEPLQILVYNEFEKIAKKRSSDASKSVDKTKILIEAMGDPTLVVKELEEKVELLWKSFNDSRKIREELVLSLEIPKGRLSKLTAEQPDISVLNASLASIKQQKAKVFQSIQVLGSSIDQDENKLTNTSNNVEKFSTQLGVLEADKVKLQEVNLRTPDLVKLDISKIVEKEIEGSGYINSLTSESLKLSKVIPDQDLCDRCIQPVSKDHRENCEVKRKADLDACNANLAKYRSVLEKVRSKKTILENELRQIETHERSKTVLERSIESKRNELEQAKTVVSSLLDTIKARKSELTNLGVSKDNLLSQETGITEQIEIVSSASNKEAIEVLKKEIERLSLLLKKLDETISSIEVQVAVATQTIAAKQLDREKLANLLAELKKQEKHHSLCLKAQFVFSPSGVPTWIINTILDDLQMKANEILAKVRPEMELSFSIIKTKNDGSQEDTLDISYRINGVEYEYEQLSGGQKVLIALTLKRASSYVIQHRIGVDIKLLNLDEVDMQFDEEMLDAFIDIIKQWQNEMTIFVITHNSYLKTKFKHAILVEGDGVNGSCGKLIYNY